MPNHLMVDLKHILGNYNQLAVMGGVVGIDIQWNCDLDWDFMRYCLPKYDFSILDETGWNFRFANYHEENRRTLIKAYGIKFLVNVHGTARKFDLKTTVILLVTGLGLLGLANVLCDFALLHCTDRLRKEIWEKKYEAINPEDEHLVKNLRSMIQSGDKNVLTSLMMMSPISPPGENTDGEITNT